MAGPALSFIKKALPWLGTAASLAFSAVPGAAPVVGIATKLLTTALNKPVTAGNIVDTLTDALSDPAQHAALMQAEMDYQKAMQAMNYQHETDMEAIAEKDRESARSMQIQTRSWMPAILSILACTTFFFCIYMVGFRSLPDTGHDALLILLGAVTVVFKDVYGYWLGSSAGSDRKTELMAQNGNGK